ncbi:hypothetical protein [Pyrobaculum islandicum]|uniref:hypothetical protein n=1 Tax=Pyrobaculum islandicum TaxID=2277 RepID=UPI001433073D|nr:hypothetical protein [Pyrobaculum islandicum]
MALYVVGLKSLLVIKGAWGQAKSFTRQTHSAVVKAALGDLAMLLTFAATRAIVIISNLPPLALSIPAIPTAVLTALAVKPPQTRFLTRLHL